MIYPQVWIYVVRDALEVSAGREIDHSVILWSERGRRAPMVAQSLCLSKLVIVEGRELGLMKIDRHASTVPKGIQ